MHSPACIKHFQMLPGMDYWSIANSNVSCMVHVYIYIMHTDKTAFIDMYICVWLFLLYCMFSYKAINFVQEPTLPKEFSSRSSVEIHDCTQ